MSGAIGVSEKEQGTRGLWWEKRRALVSYLVDRGHTVDFVNRMTKFSDYMPVAKYENHDLLMIEFGSSNKSFYGKDLEETQAVVSSHKGSIVFLCDDPDLPYLWDTPIGDRSRWSCWYNAVTPMAFGGQPRDIKMFDFPFSALMEPKEPKDDYQREAFVYIGRPGGRSKIIKHLMVEKAPWKVYGRREEWEEFGIMTHKAPDQPQRAEFYSNQLGSIVLADSKHKTMGWRTGRAYHAIMAGCPAIVEGDHYQLQGFHKFYSAEDVRKYLHAWRDGDLRRSAWNSQIQHMWHERSIADKTLVAHGL